DLPGRLHVNVAVPKKHWTHSLPPFHRNVESECSPVGNRRRRPGAERAQRGWGCRARDRGGGRRARPRSHGVRNRPPAQETQAAGAPAHERAAGGPCTCGSAHDCTKTKLRNAFVVPPKETRGTGAQGRLHCLLVKWLSPAGGSVSSRDH